MSDPPLVIHRSNSARSIGGLTTEPRGDALQEGRGGACRKKGSRRPSLEETDAELSQCGVL